MEDKENLEAFDNLTPIWDSLPINISWQIFHRDNDEFSIWELSVQQIKIGINMSILLNASCMIEGYLEEKIRLMYSSKYKSALNDFEKRQQKSFLHSVNNATFSKYNDLYKLVSGLEIKEIIGSPNAELWKDITKLFEIRNIIAHSQSIETNIDLSKIRFITSVRISGFF